jgi:hypothetical protein
MMGMMNNQICRLPHLSVRILQMLRRLGMFAVAIVALFSAFVSFESKSEANNRAAVRAQIRSMPMLDRPYRVGHVYGNTVRRAAK